MQSLIDYFESYIPLNTEEKQLISSKIVFNNIKRRQVILYEGMICKHYTFVKNGCLKLYGVDDKGYQHNIQFAAESDWIADIGSFYAKKPSKLYIEAIEPSTILQIEQQDLYFLYSNIPKLSIARANASNFD